MGATRGDRLTEEDRRFDCSRLVTGTTVATEEAGGFVLVDLVELKSADEDDAVCNCFRP